MARTFTVLILTMISQHMLQHHSAEGAPLDPDDVTGDRDDSQPQSRMHNGDSTTIEEYPFMASIHKDYQYLCSGTLLRGGHILTAAHCLVNHEGYPDATADQLQVRLGNTYRYRRVAYIPGKAHHINRRYHVEEILRFSNRRLESGGPWKDIAILVLDVTPVTDFWVAPISPLDYFPSGEVRGLGWGYTTGSDTSLAPTLQTQHLDIKDTSAGCPCHSSDYEFCAEARSGQMCQGDSGGPVVKQVSGRWYVVGVLSGVWDGCSWDNRQAVYTKVAAFYDWINDPRAATDTDALAGIVCDAYGPRLLTSSEKEDDDDDDSGGGGGGGCFPGTSMVHIQNHPDPVAISSLQPGDEVLTLSSSGQLIYSPFISYLHKQPSTHTQYLTIHTQHNHTLHVSHNHLLYKANIQNQVTDHDFAGSYVFAGDVSVGDALIGLSDAISVTIVTSIDSSSMVGVYAPLTDAGTIVVDGVFASCYATSPYQNVNHLGTLPYRMWVKVTRAWYGDGAKGEDDQVMPPYIELLYHYALPALLSF